MPSLNFENEFFVTRLGTLSKLVLLPPGVDPKHDDDIIDTCIKYILLETHEPNEGSEEWIKDDDLGAECRAKVIDLQRTIDNLDSRIEDSGE
jgi:hypothetical protein